MWQRLELPVPILLPTPLPAELQEHQVALFKVFDKPKSPRHHENSQLLAEKLSKVQLHVKFIQAKRLCLKNGLKSLIGPYGIYLREFAT